jgi:hypothetical protein
LLASQPHCRSHLLQATDISQIVAVQLLVTATALAQRIATPYFPGPWRISPALPQTWQPKQGTIPVLTYPRAWNSQFLWVEQFEDTIENRHPMGSSKDITSPRWHRELLHHRKKPPATPTRDRASLRIYYNINERIWAHYRSIGIKNCEGTPTDGTGV